MKGLTIPLTVVLTLVVILIVAVIVLVIFQGGLGPAVSFTEAGSSCRLEAAGSCNSFNSMPPAWAVQTKGVKNAEGMTEWKSCQQIVQIGGSGNCICTDKKLSGC